MSFIKNFISRKLNRQPERTNLVNEEKTSMIVMQSNTLGMTVVEEEGDQQDKCIKQISQQEWVDIIMNGKLDGIPYNRIYFSFLKGLPDFMRMKIWLMLCTENSSRNYNFSADMGRKSIQAMQQKQCQQKQQKIEQKSVKSIFTLELFRKLTSSKPMQKQSQQIQKDIKRTYSSKLKFTYTIPLMRKILYALSNSGVEYTQGMNYILLYIIIFCLESLGLDETTYKALSEENQRDIFVILRQIVLRLDEVFDNQNIFKVLKQLEQKISETVPDIFFLIYKLGMDTYSLFSQNYYSLLTYSDPPEQLTKQMIDLFFLESDKAITSLIVRMLEISRQQILKIKDPEKMQYFVKNQMFHFCFKTLTQEKINAKKIQDFGISFYHSVDRC